MVNPVFYFKSHFSKSDYIHSLLEGGIWCIAIASVLWSIRKWHASKKSFVPIPGLKTPLCSLFGSLYTLPSTKFMKKSSLPVTAFIMETLSGHSKLFEKEKLFYFDIGPARMIILRKPEVIEGLLKSTTMLRKAWGYDFLIPWLGTGLLTSGGTKWKSRRKLLTPSFHFDILKDFLPIIDEQSRILVDFLKEKINEDFVDVVHPVALCTLDIVCASALGVDVGAQKNSESEYVQAVLRISQLIMDRMCTPYLWPELLFRMSARGRQFRTSVRNLHKFTRKVIRERQAAFKQRHDEEEVNDTLYADPRRKRKALMDLLIEHQMKHHDITEEGIREEVDSFAFAGHDTTSMGISWALYMIGLYPDIQAKLHEEMDSIFGDDRDTPVTEDDIRGMRYLDCVMKESQRLYPSVPSFARQVEEDQDFCGYRVKKGTMLGVLTYLLHRESETFPNPEIFDPDRFLPENCSGRHPFAYIPFSGGPRNCIGQRFALMEEKTVMANILRNFHVTSLDQRDKVIPAFDLILRPTSPLRLKFRLRKSAFSSA